MTTTLKTRQTPADDQSCGWFELLPPRERPPGSREAGQQADWAGPAHPPGQAVDDRPWARRLSHRAASCQVLHAGRGEFGGDVQRRLPAEWNHDALGLVFLVDAQRSPGCH